MVERALVKSAQRSLTLSAAQRAAVLAALFAEAARLQAEHLRRMQRRADLKRTLSRLFSPSMLAAWSAGVVCVFACIAYLLLGGARIPAHASLSGHVELRELRRGPFGLTWSVMHPPEEWQACALHRGDELLATTLVTITFADASRTIAAPGTRPRVLSDRSGLALIHGEIANAVSPSDDGTIAFHIETAVGSMSVKCARFRVRTERDGSVSEFTDEGWVAVANDVGVVDVITSEQVRLRAGAPLKVELQIPHVTFNTRAKDRVVSHTPRVAFSTRIFPHATLIVESARSGRQFARYVADNAGWVRDILPAVEDAVVLRFSQVAPDGRASAPSPPVEIVIDRTPPTLAIARMLRDGSKVQIYGRTEVGASVHVNSVPVTLNSDGAFVFESNALLDGASVTVTAIDAAGNSTRIIQTLTR